MKDIMRPKYLASTANTLPDSNGSCMVEVRLGTSKIPLLALGSLSHVQA